MKHWILGLLLTFMASLSLAGEGSLDQRLPEAMREFPVIIYVNKSVKSKYAQRIFVFKYGKLMTTEKISTGREQFEAERFSATPTGFFTPTYLSEDHVASQSGVPMPFAIFFNGNIALHQAVKDNNGVFQLGRRASAGCVRLSPGLAPKLFDLVTETGKGRMPIIHEDGTVAVTADGEVYKKDSYMTLIVVDDSTSESPRLLRKIQEAIR